jgi:molybdenum cofactor cytidylyltransferase
VDRRDGVAGVILAAGTSSRMGRNKLLLQLGGRSVLRRAVDTALAAGLDPVLVVVGHQREQAEAELRDARCKLVANPDYQDGVNTSLRTGIRAVPEGCPAAVVMLADMPLVTPAMLRTMLEQYRGGRAPLVVSSYDGIDAPPILYDRSLFDELRVLEGEGCGKKVVKRHTEEALRLPWPALALTDLDLPADVDRVRAQLGEGR